MNHSICVSFSALSSLPAPPPTFHLHSFASFIFTAGTRRARSDSGQGTCMQASGRLTVYTEFVSIGFSSNYFKTEFQRVTGSEKRTATRSPVNGDPGNRRLPVLLSTPPPPRGGKMEPREVNQTFLTGASPSHRQGQHWPSRQAPQECPSVTQTWQSLFLFISNSPKYPGSVILVSTEELPLPELPALLCRQELTAPSVCPARRPLPQQDVCAARSPTHPLPTAKAFPDP